MPQAARRNIPGSLGENEPGSLRLSRIGPTWRILGGLRQGIGLRLLAGVILFSSAVTVIVTLLELYLDYRHDVGAIESRMSEIEGSYLDSLGEGLWNLDRRQLRLQVEGIRRLPGIAFVEVRETTDRTNPMVVDAGDHQNDAPVSRQFPLFHISGAGEQQLGILSVEATFAEIYRTLLARTIVILLSQGAKTFLVSFFILYITHRLVTRHLTALAGFLEKYELRRPLPPLRLQRRTPKEKDEFDRVVTAVETMRQSLERAYDDLRRSEAYLAEAQSLSHTGSWAWNVATREITHWSHELDRLYGFYPEDGVPSFAAIVERVHPEDRGNLLADLDRAIRDRSDHEMVFRAILPGGAVRYLHSVGHPILGPTGDVVEFVGTSFDVTERKRAEEEHRAHLWFFESLDRVNRAIQGTNDVERLMGDVVETVLAIFACDRAWLVYPCDAEAVSWQAQMERTRPDFPGAFALGVELPVDSEVAAVFRAVRSSCGAVQFGPGSAHPVPFQLAERFSIRSLIGMAIYPKLDRPYMFGLHQCSDARIWTAQEERLFREIGRRLADALTTSLAFRDLRESEAKLENAQSVAHVGYWHRDLDTDHIAWSNETYRIFGLKPQERWLTSGGLLELIHPDDREVTERAIAAALRGGPRYDLEYRAVRPDGEVRIVHVQGDVARDESGQPLGMFGTVQDVTERRRAQEELRASDRRYREAQLELAHVNRVTTMGQLTASIAHEVNHPIAAAVTNAQAALRWLGAQPPDLERARQAIGRAVKDGIRAGDVIGRIRAFIMKDSSRRDTLDINEAVLEIVALTRNELLRGGVSLQTRLATGLPSVQGDRIQLQQVILNFIINAIEAMSAVSNGERALLISSEPDGPHGVRVAVQDSGPGLPSGSLARLFDAFYTTKPGGMGMGLSICRSIIEAHDGRVWAGANAPNGAVFQFTLPAAADQE